MNITYLVSKYPAVSHTFIQREVARLRGLGWRIQTVSVNEPDAPPAGAMADYATEAQNTHVIKRQVLRQALSALGWAVLRHPLRLLKATRFMLGHQPTLKSPVYLIEALILARRMAQDGQTRLHVHFGNAAASVGLLASVFSGCRFTLTVHGPDEFEQAHAQQLGLKIRHAEQVVCISRYARQQAMRYSTPEDWPKLVVCPLGVDAEEFGGEPPIHPPHQPLRLLCVGRLCAAKGQHLLLLAMDELRARGLECRLDLVGDGPDRQSLEATSRTLQLQTRVTFHGAVGIAQVRQFMRQADLFVLPSFAEGVPVVLMEAMATGVPCISTTITGIPELITHNEEGILVPPGDAHALAEQIQRLALDPELRCRLAQRGREKVQHSYNLGRNVARLSDLLAP